MHLRRVAAFLLGAWIVGCLFMAFIDLRSSQSAETILTRPPGEIAKLIKAAGYEPVAQLLAHHQAELTNQYMWAWGVTQLLIGASLIVVLVYATHISRLGIGLGGAMMILAVFGYFVLAPEITFLRRGIEFAQGWSADRARYLALRGAFLMVEAVKLALGCVLAGYLFLFKTPRLRRRTDVEAEEAAGEARLS
ncbi:MAG: hypothetical protein JSU00_13350 [Acidobacteria bacterium]|nr:hypothetical protein [Acidobacteriota bacterium]